MKRWTRALVAVSAAVILASCGGGGGGVAGSNSTGFTQMVVFGDSLSDIGTYKVGTIAAVGGGKWTVNAPTAKNWTELIAAQYNLPTPCPAQTGLPSVLFPGFVGASIQNFPDCRNYAQGSSRVTSLFSPSSLAVQAAVYQAYGGPAGYPAATAASYPAAANAAASAAGLGLMAVPVVTQMNTHLSNVGGSYSGKELVAVMAGGNDFFMNLNGVSAAAAGGNGAAAAAQFAGWSPAVQTAVFAGGAAAANAAANAAVAGMAQAATELATDIKTLVLAKGATHVLVVNLPDVTQTPFGDTFDAPTKSLGTSMITAFNSTLQTDLAGVSGVLVVDAYTQGQDQTAHPAQYSLTNVTTPACSATSPANPLAGSSIACTAASTIPGDTSHYQYADTVHPTPYGYQLLARYVTLKLIAAGWQ
ncbi:SGNH/GDSL hydrolase family protein [Polaromonas sp. C04]|uniref:SGNH/GDSL hydrolase family protein n=1 Tax=Polaromonas sp. C04 TaxID=1945857 RepID=UPI000984789E|nr:SGNH/GDSL hydrolase family protein [Polaromonas sp. C04]